MKGCRVERKQSATLSPPVGAISVAWHGRMGRKSLIWTAVAAIGVAFAMYWFTPWRAFTTNTVADELPVLAPTTTASQASASPTPDSTSGTRAIAQGVFVTHAHKTTGVVQIVQLAGGSHQLVIRACGHPTVPMCGSG